MRRPFAWLQITGPVSQGEVSELTPLDIVVATQTLVSCTELDIDTPFVEAGLDSHGFVALRARIKQNSASDLPTSLVFDFPTARLLAEGATQVAKGTMSSFSSGSGLLPLLESRAFGRRAVVLQRGKANKMRGPLVALHTPDGLCAIFQALRDALDKAQVFLAVEHGAIRSGDVAYKRISNLEEMAIDYARLVIAVLSVFDHTTAHMIGASFGAALAHCTATAIDTSGATLSSVVLIDPPPPGLRGLKSLKFVSTLDWRRMAAASLLLRSGVVAKQYIAEQDALSLFASLPLEEIDLVFAQRLAELGVASSSMRTVIDARRQLDTWVCSQLAMLRSEWGNAFGAVSGSLCLLVLSCARDLFFGEITTASALSEYFGSEALVLDGNHFEVMTACCAGNDMRFLSHLLEHLNQSH